MELPTNPSQLVDLLRAWFFAKDRSVVLANNTFVEGENISTPGTPVVGRGRLYWKNKCWYQLDENGVERPICGGWQLIKTQTLAAAAASVTFSNLPTFYSDLQITMQARGSGAAELVNVIIRFNGDSSAIYDWSQKYNNGSTYTGSSSTAQTSIFIAIVEAANCRASNFTPAIINIPAYNRTDREKWAMCSNSGAFGDVSATTDMYLADRRGRWRNTAAITSILLAPSDGTNFVSGSIFSLYGLV